MNDIQLYLGDCLKIMESIPDHSIDMILCDLPYGTSACKWDSIIPLTLLWPHYNRLIKETSAIVLFAQQPFTSILIHSNLANWRYNYIWKKDNATNFLNSHHQPLKITEDICVFSKVSSQQINYHPQFGKGKPYVCLRGKQKNESAVITGDVHKIEGFKTESKGHRYPLNLIEFKRDTPKVHPTQKPVELCKWLISTFTKENDTILDNTMGSGSTGVAAKLLNRKFIGIEMEENYIKIASERIKNTKAEEK
jgi:site-specific DNA-methyltransferase (adenine-specific)